MRNLYLLSAGLLLAGRALAQSAALAPPTFTWGTAYNIVGQPINGSVYPVGPAAVAVAASGDVWVNAPDSVYSFIDGGLSRQRLERRLPNGTLAFRRYLNGRSHVMQLRTAPNGRVYVLGFYVQSVTLSPTVTLNTTDTTPHDFLACFDASGAVLYAKDLTGPGARNVKPCALVPGPADHVYVGMDPSFGTTTNTRIIEYDAQGLPVRTIAQTGGMSVTGLDLDGTGALFVTGTCTRPTGGSFGGTAVVPGVSGNGYNQYLACYEPTGTLRWVKFIGDVTCTAPQVRHDGAGGVYWLTTLHDAATLGGITVAGPSNGGTDDFMLARLTAAGTVLWMQDVASTQPGTTMQSASAGMSSSQIQCLDTDAAGNVYLTGQTKGTLHWGGGLQTSTGFNAELLVQRRSPAGVVEWTRTAPSAQGPVQGGALTVAPDGTVLVSGLGVGPMSLDGLPMPTVNRNHLFVARLTPAARPSATAAGTAPGLWQLAPNPAASRCTLRPPAGTGPVRAELRDALGRTLAYTTAEIPAFDLSAYPPGVYVLRATAATGTWTGRVVKE